MSQSVITTGVQNHQKTNLTKKYTIEAKAGEQVDCDSWTLFFSIAPRYLSCPCNLHWQMVQMSLYMVLLNTVKQ